MADEMHRPEFQGTNEPDQVLHMRIEGQHLVFPERLIWVIATTAYGDGPIGPSENG